MYWISADGPTFHTPGEAILDWARDHDTLPSVVFYGTTGRGIAIIPNDKDNWLFHAGYRLGKTF